MNLLSDAEIGQRMVKLPDWIRVDQRIERRFNFVDFDALMGFINGVAAIAREQDHHPEVQFAYSNCTVSYTTHSAGGLTAKDFAAAARVNEL